MGRYPAGVTQGRSIKLWPWSQLLWIQSASADHGAPDAAGRWTPLDLIDLFPNWIDLGQVPSLFLVTLDDRPRSLKEREDQDRP